MAIDAALVAGVSYRVIAERFVVGHNSVARHSANHLTPAQRAAIATATQPLAIDADALAEREGSNLLSHVAAQRARLLADADTCRGAGDLDGAIAAERALTSTLVVTGKLVGQFTTKIDVRHTHALLDPRWIETRHAIVAALKPFPDALRAVVAAIQAREQVTADDIQRKPAALPAPIDAEFEEVPAIPPCPIPAPAAPC